MELITTRTEFNGDWENDLTREMDKHLLPGCPEYFKTYLWHRFDPDGVAIRYPGATRGHIEFNEEMIITKIVLYDTAFDHKGVRCYEPTVEQAVQRFIGDKIVCVETEVPKEVVIVGEPKKPNLMKSFVTSTVAALGGNYDDVILPRVKVDRNVPEYARKKERGRNEPCSCGSGLKYKKCCGR